MNTDSPVTPLLNLTVIGNINNFVRIIPNRVILNGFTGDPIERTVKIIPEEKYPFKMVGDRTVRAKNTFAMNWRRPSDQKRQGMF